MPASSVISRVRLFATPRTVARQAPLSMGFSRQGYCSGLPFPPPKKGVRPEKRSPEGQERERTEGEPEGRGDWKGEERAGAAAGRPLGWGYSQSLTLEQLPPFTEMSRNPVHPRIAKLLAWQLFWQSSADGSVRSSEVGCVGLQVRGSPGGCLGDDWPAGNPHSLHSPLFRPVCSIWRGKLENRSISIYLEIRR